MFNVKLIEVDETTCQDARDNLYSNCTHVAKNYWLFEGGVDGLHEGISFTVIGEKVIEGYGDMSGSELKKMVCEEYNVDRCFIY